MANEQNLKPGGAGHRLTVEEAQRGGKASAKAKKRKKTMAQFAAMISKAPVTDENAKEALRGAGIDDEDMINSALVVFGVFRQAVLGDMKAVEKWQELTEPKKDTACENRITVVMDSSVSDLME